MEYTLRIATCEDLPAIDELVKEMFRSITGEADPKGYESGALDYYFSGGEDKILVAEVNKKVVAFLSIEVHHDRGDYLYFDDFCVSPTFRSLGIGTAMAAEAETFAKSIGATAIALHVEKTNSGAQKLYKQLGFEISGERDSRHLMIKEL